jgi:hypothetical protein
MLVLKVNNNININDPSFKLDNCLKVIRGAQPNSSFLWIESSGKWAANNGNGSIFIAADSAESYANSAFAAANAAQSTATQALVEISANTYLQEYINLTQNNNITSAFAAANSASVYANGAFAAANAATATDITQNNSITAAFTAANSSGSYANSAFLVANSAAAYSNTVNNTQNTSITAAFTAANSAGVYANGAFDKANTDFTNITISPSQAYGNATHIPIVTVSANGRINAISTVAVTATDPSAIAFAIALG